MGVRQVLPMVLLAVACSSSTVDPYPPYDTAATTITPDAYSNACTGDADCVAVLTGDVCKFCNACYTDTAISQSDVVQYDRDVQEKRKGCPLRVERNCTEDCPPRRAICEGGRCIHEVCSGPCTARDAGTD